MTIQMIRWPKRLIVMTIQMIRWQSVASLKMGGAYRIVWAVGAFRLISMASTANIPICMQAPDPYLQSPQTPLSHSSQPSGMCVRHQTTFCTASTVLFCKGSLGSNRGSYSDPALARSQRNHRMGTCIFRSRTCAQPKESSYGNTQRDISWRNGWSVDVKDHWKRTRRPR